MSEKSAEEKQNSSTVKAETSVAAEKAFGRILKKKKLPACSFMMWETQFTRMSSAVIFLYRGRVCLLWF